MTRRAAAVAAAVVVLLVAAAPAPAKVRWQPKPGLRWQYQLQGKANTGICAKPPRGGPCVRPQVFVIDLYADDGTTPNAAAVRQIHARHAHAVCYVDAGTWEN